MIRGRFAEVHLGDFRAESKDCCAFWFDSEDRLDRAELILRRWADLEAIVARLNAGEGRLANEQKPQ